MNILHTGARAILPRGALPRAAVFLGFWLMLSGVDPAGLPAGAIAVAAATWTSLHLLPAGEWQLRPFALLGFVLRFLRQSVVAGVDVAWRALDPRMPLQPGFVRCPLRFPPGAACNTFCTLTSLLPGTVPSGVDESGNLVVHCLDLRQPVVALLEEEEARLARVLGWGSSDG